MSVPLRQIAAVIRSKNAGPGKLTLDIIFRSAAWFDRVAASGAINPALIAGLYGRLQEEVEIALFPPASAIKITMPRRTVSGSVGDTDIYGAQQHGPLLELVLHGLDASPRD